MTYSTFIHSGIVNPKTTTIKENTDSSDFISFDIPLLTRILELTRENIKSDEELHQLLTNLINVKNRGVLSMNDYNDILNKNDDELDSIKKLAGLQK